MTVEWCGALNAMLRSLPRYGMIGREIRRMPRELTDESPFPFGVHKGKKMENVPASYLDWFDGQDWSKDWPLVKAYVKKNRAVLNMEIDQQGCGE